MQSCSLQRKKPFLHQTKQYIKSIFRDRSRQHTEPLLPRYHTVESTLEQEQFQKHFDALCDNATETESDTDIETNGIDLHCSSNLNSTLYKT